MLNIMHSFDIDDVVIAWHFPKCFVATFCFANIIQCNEKLSIVYHIHYKADGTLFNFRHQLTLSSGNEQKSLKANHTGRIIIPPQHFNTKFHRIFHMRT